MQNGRKGRARHIAWLMALLCVALTAIVAAPPAAAAPPTWWDGNYSHRLGVSIVTSDALPSGYSVSATFDHAGAVAAGASLASGNDVRVARWDGAAWTELDRVVDPATGWNSSTTKVWFKAPSTIGAATTDTSFYLYYGYAAAGSPPANGNNVFLLWDDFSAGSVNAAKWTVDATSLTATQTGGELKIAGTTGLLGGGITSVNTFGPDVMIEASARIVTQSAAAQKNFQMCVTPSYWACVYSNNSTTKRVQWNDYGPWYDMGASTLQSQTFSYHRLGVATTTNGTVSAFEDGALVATRKNVTFATNVNLNYHPVTSATVDARFDDVFVRKYVAHEPSVVTDKTNDITVTMDVKPILAFSVSGHAGACNGVTQTAAQAPTATMVRLAPVTTISNAVSAQDLTLQSNAGVGATVSIRAASQPTNGNGRPLVAVGGTNGAPTTFPSPGTEAFGYTTSDSTLTAGGTANRFTSPAARWAPLAATAAPVLYTTGTGSKLVCVAFQFGMASTTPAGNYTVPVIYSAIPTY